MPGRRAGVLFEAATRAKALAPAFAAVGLPVETGGSPKFPQKPLPLRSCSFDPGRSRHRSPLSLCRTRPRGRERPWLLRETFEAQSHGSSARCLRFAPTRCRPARKTRFRLRGCALPGGACTHWVSQGKVSVTWACHISFSFRELAWRNPVFPSRLSLRARDDCSCV